MNKDAAVWSPAGFWIRGVAWFIDAVILGILFSPLSRDKVWLDQHLLEFSALSMVLQGLYAGICNHWWQGTIGKKVLNIKIVSAEDGGKVSFLVMGFRETIGRIVSMLPIFMGLIWAAFNNEKKSLHDHIFATRVVRKVPVAHFGDVKESQ